ncbi:hypothetical protein BV25DRAFT_1415641 [Artomyces pyxidatus]|uniref:Uncharacterized protein n=1 Tax=Artomyces pyxidatus TaxID=48021 RepID=A0ACB8TE41_9AGAM|nr:hypothetical protein BV25DRAFT_1415641 [Artomyces pyxidatus]
MAQGIPSGASWHLTTPRGLPHTQSVSLPESLISLKDTRAFPPLRHPRGPARDGPASPAPKRSMAERRAPPWPVHGRAACPRARQTRSTLCVPCSRYTEYAESAFAELPSPCTHRPAARGLRDRPSYSRKDVGRVSRSSDGWPLGCARPRLHPSRAACPLWPRPSCRDAVGLGSRFSAQLGRRQDRATHG